ncbi:capsid assembly scaffolding protein Gp46 family protein [Clostridium sp.]|uniref:capsid assembly scaffolding protein Gp46 family protein n=1 Tax=Clostridium sp. TaxID=1506 RepID=UPI002909929A|nr:DUF4355 domain-containing protein [Clostridium sp.]MDU3410676.1 DUF4355 domain-containing protein [Clostridium sp.]
MKKSELLDLLKDISDETDINETLQGVEGLIKPLDINSIGLEEFKNVLENNKEAKAYYQSTLDSGIGKGVAAFKEKTLPGIIEEELKKANNKNKTPEQIKLEELETKLAEMEAQKIRAELQNKYTKTLTEKGFDTNLLDLCFDENEENFNSKLEKITNIIQASTEKEVQTRLKDGEYKPPKSNNPNVITKEDFSKMGYKERTNLYSENKALYDELSKE